MCLFHVSLSCRFSFSLECGKKQTAEAVRWKGVILGNTDLTLSNNSATPRSVEMWGSVLLLRLPSGCSSLLE